MPTLPLLLSPLLLLWVPKHFMDGWECRIALAAGSVRGLGVSGILAPRSSSSASVTNFWLVVQQTEGVFT